MSSVLVDSSFVGFTSDAVPQGTVNYFYVPTNVRGTTLDGLTVSPNSPVVATDTVLIAFGKVQAEINSILSNINIVSSFSYEGLPLTAPKFIHASVNSSANGNNDVYTVPAGKRALISGLTAYAIAGSQTIYPLIKISGVYFRLTPNLTIGSAQLYSNIDIGYIAEAGETVSVSVASTNVNAYFKIIEFDNTTSLRSAKLASLASGNNTVYTVPSGKSTLLLDSQALKNGDSTFSALFYVNESGGSRTITWYIVPSGQSVGTTYQVSKATGVANDTRFNSDAELTLSTGDYIVINTNASTASQLAWVNVLEI